MRRSLRAIILVSALLLQNGLAAMAQDSTGTDAPGANQVFLPLVATENSAAQTDAADEADPLTPVTGSISPLSQESVAKPEVGAAGRITDPLRPVSLIVTFDGGVSADQLAAATGGQVVHRYTKVFNGASLVVAQGQADVLAGLNGVTGVYLDELQQLNTDVSPAFINAPKIWQQLGGQESAGEGVIVGILDSGIWPEHPSVSDPDPSGKPYAAPPVMPGANGFSGGEARDTCDFGNTAYNANDVAFTCNNKLIGAYSFIDTYKAVNNGLLATEFDSARDDNGHGTHTATTSAGNANVAAELFGVDRGIISGIAPRAHIIAYRVCGDVGCYQSDSIAAVEQAILDKVDVINFSISGGNNPYSDIVEQAFLEAYENGVFVATSAGNSGPGADTVSHRGPWVTTVAASTSDRHFLSTVTLVANNGDTLKLVGATVTAGVTSPLPVVFATDPLCGVMAPGTYQGQMVICDRGVYGRIEKGYNVAQAGGGAMILRNLIVQGLNTDNHFVPSIHLDGPEGNKLKAFMDSHTGVVATFPGGTATKVQGDVMASFSSRGGPGQTLGVSKPDVTAPGVQILAGHTPLPATPDGGLPGQLFQAIQGTSMSSPHVAGAGALLAALHPEWTPGQIKSALMTTAKISGVVKEDGKTKADTFDYGAGRIDLKVASDPGLTIDESADNYRALAADLWNANYPSLYHPALPGALTVERTVKSVLGANSTWKLGTRTDQSDWSIEVPNSITVPGMGEATFAITIQAGAVPLGQVRHGLVRLTDGKHELHIPVSFVRGQAPILVEKACAPRNFRLASKTTCTITLQNSTFTEAQVDLYEKMPHGLNLVNNSLTGATIVSPNAIRFTGTLAPAQPPTVAVSVDGAASPAGYLPLAGFSGSVKINASDESITNFTVPDFVYAGQVYDRIGIVSNGYIVVGGGTGADVAYINPAPLPNAQVPNNVLAPFWTDLNPAAGGQILINVLGDGTNSWIVVEWESVPTYTDEEPSTFQVWLGINGVNDISFVYGTEVNDGDLGILTVGAENSFGNSGGMVYYNGEGEAPAPSYPDGTYEVLVSADAGNPGAAHVISYQMSATQTGKWNNCTELTSDAFQGVAINCFSGRVR